MKDFILLFDDCCIYEVVILNYFLNFSGCDVKFISLNQKTIIAMEGYSINTDCFLKDIDINEARSFVIPGGKVDSIKTNDLFDFLILAKKKGVLIGAICAGVDVLDEATILSDVKSTHSENVDCICDGNVVTAKANGYVDFAIEMAKKLNLFVSEEDLRETIDFWKYHKGLR